MKWSKPRYHLWLFALVTLAPLALMGIRGAWASDAFQFFVDDGGVNQIDNNSGGTQSDLTQVGVDKTHLASGFLWLQWSWDSTDSWTGNGQTGDACALFDTDGDGNANYSLCVQIRNPQGNSGSVITASANPLLFACDDSRTDRCGNPSSRSLNGTDMLTLGGNTNTQSNSLITATDPFVGGSNTPNDSTIVLKIATADLPAGAQLLNVCSYPSAANGGNNAPGDCVFIPGSGFLTIIKTTDIATSDPFTFNLNPAATDGTTQFTINGAGTVVSRKSLDADENFSLQEVLPTGWLLGSASCTGTGTFNSNTKTISGIDILGGRETTCTFNNVRATGKITFQKVVIGGGNAADWQFDLVNGLQNIAHNSQVTLNTGAYVVTEETLNGVNAADYTLTSASGACALNNGAIQLTVTTANTICTITNTRKTGKITFQKVVVGTGNATDWQFDVTNSTQNIAHNSQITLNTGAYVVTEETINGVNGADYTLTSASGACALVNGAIQLTVTTTDATCIVTNTRKTGKITFQKVVVGTGNATDWRFDVTGGPQDVAHNGNVTLDTGSYVVTEEAISPVNAADYTVTSASGACALENSAIKLTVTTSDAICTLTNTRKTGRITFEKVIVGAGSAADWQFDVINGPQNIAHGGSATLETGAYIITEETLNGANAGDYTLTGASGACTLLNGAITLTVAEGASTCTVTNTLKRGKIIVIKQTHPDGAADLFTFTPTNFNSGATFQLADNGQPAEFGNLLPGRYAVAEGAQAGWAQTDAECVDSSANEPKSTPSDIRLDPDETVTCTFTNTQKGNITIVKKSVGGDDAFGFDTHSDNGADFTITTSGGVGSDVTHFAAALPGVYTVSEIVPAGWDLTDLACDSSAQVDLTNKKAIINLTAGIGVTCTYTNTKRGQIVVKKQTEGGEGVFHFTTNVGLGAFDIATINQSGVFTLPDLKPNLSYSVVETVPADWQLTSATCSGTNNTPAQISLEPGETVVCTFINAKNGSIKLEKKTLGGDGKFDFTSTTLNPTDFSITTVGGSGSLTLPNLPSGVYDINEIVPTGWKLTEAICDDESDPASIALAAGENITCTITNTKQANITIVKKSVGTTGVFTFTSGAVSPSPFTITTDVNNEGSKAFTNLTPGASYGFTELTKAGWQLTNINCIGGSNITIGATDVTIIPAAGENIICTFTNDPLPTAIVTKRANPTSLPEPGGPVVFTVEIKNTSAEPINLTALNDAPFGDVIPQGGQIIQTNCAVTSILPNATYTCSFTANVTGEPGDYKDTVTAELQDDEGNLITPQGEATVTITDVPPQARVTKQPQPSSLPEPGGPVTFTVTVANLSATEAFTIETLMDSPYGDVTQAPAVDPILRTTCSTPQVVQPETSYSCTFTVNLANSAPGSYADTITAAVIDNDSKEPLEFTADAKVVINDLPGSIMVTKTANPVSIPESGGSVNYTIVVKNTSASDDVTLSTIIDDKFGDLTAACGLAGITLAPGASFTCTFAHQFPATNSPLTHVNKVVVTGLDDDQRPVTAEDTETVAITNVPPLINVTKSADRTSIPEPGGKVTFTVVVENISVIDTVTISEVTDSLYGDIGGSCQPSLTATLQPGEKVTCQFSRDITGPVGAIHHNVATARGKDNDGTPVEGSDEAEIHIIDIPSSINVIKLSNPTSVVEPGGNVVFTVMIENTSLQDNVTISQVTDSVYGDISPFCKIGVTPISAQQLLQRGEVITCTFTKVVTGDAGFIHRNVVTVKGTDDDGRPVQDTDEERVGVTDAKPDISVSKTADPLVVPESGGLVTFKVVVVNNSVEAVTLTSLVDSAFGDLDGKGACDVPQTLAAQGGSYSCTFTQNLSGNANELHTNVVTAVATDNEANSTLDSDDATVFFSDVQPVIEVVKTADPERVPETGGAVTFTVKVVNNSSEPATLESLVDSVFGNLKNEGTCKVPQTLAANGGTYTCSFTKTVSGSPNAPHNNTVIATVTDDDGNECQHTDDAIVRFTGVNPNLFLTKTASLLVDEFDRPQDQGKISPGDTLRYNIVIENLGDGAATGVVFEDIPDPNTKLVAGSVKTNKGTILTGNGANDAKVVVSIGVIAPNREEKVQISFDVVITKGTGATLLRNQGIVSVIDQREPGGVSSTPSDDPATPKVEDPTNTEVVLPPTALDEEEEPGGTSDLRLFLPVMRK